MAATSEANDYVHRFARMVQQTMPGKKVRVVFGTGGRPDLAVASVEQEKALRPDLILVQNGEHSAFGETAKRFPADYEKLLKAYNDAKTADEALGDPATELLHLAAEEETLRLLADLAPRLAAAEASLQKVEADIQAATDREAAALQIEYTDLIDALFLEVNPIPIKAAMNLAGYDVGSLRLPLCDMSNGHLETLRQAMISAGILS